MSDITRRTVVQTAAIVPFQAVAGSAQNSAIRIGVIGTGSRGTYIARTVSKDPKAKVVAICDVSDGQLAAARNF